VGCIPEDSKLTQETGCNSVNKVNRAPGGPARGKPHQGMKDG